MATIYGSALLTISVNTEQNLFGLLLEHYSEMNDFLKELSNLYKSSQDAFRGDFIAKLKGILEGGIIGTRGWCLQERQLSPRVLHVLDEGVFIWECVSCIRIGSERLPFAPSDLELGKSTPKIPRPLHLDRLVDYEQKSFFDSSYFQQAGLFNTYDRKEILVNYWQRFVADFQRRQLSDPGDNLAALSGMVAAISRNYLPGLYLSGIWSQDLPRGLLQARQIHKDMPPERQRWRGVLKLPGTFMVVVLD